MNKDVSLFLLVVASGAAMTIAVRQMAVKMGIVNNPNPIVPQHLKPVAYLGGVGVFLGILIGLIWTQILGIQDQETRFDIGPYLNTTSLKSMLRVFVGGFLFLVFGVADDILTLQPFRKLMGQFAIATAIVSIGIQCHYFGQPIVDFLVSVFWIVTVVNAVNFTDVCDGLVGTITAIAFLSVAFLVPETRNFCLLICASVIGFLFFNFPRASIFLGDAGSHLLGYLLAIVGLIGGSGDVIINNVVWMVSVVGVPLFELVFITVVRVQRGVPWWRGSPDHFSLRMQAGGFSRISINLLAGLATLISILSWHVYSTAPGVLKLLIAIGVLSACFSFSNTLMRWDVRRSQ